MTVYVTWERDGRPFVDGVPYNSWSLYEMEMDLGAVTSILASFYWTGEDVYRGPVANEIKQAREIMLEAESKMRQLFEARRNEAISALKELPDAIHVAT